MKITNNNFYTRIEDNYINGNRSDAKEQIKKLTKKQRKELFMFIGKNFQPDAKQLFFFNLI